MRLLDRYLLRELLTPLAFCLGGFLIFWSAFNLFNDLPEMQERKLHFLDVLAYTAAMTPEFLVTILPIALLLALLYALTNHARHNEITAMRAAGISLWRLCVPYFIIGLAASAALFALNEFLVPVSTDWSWQIKSRYVHKADDPDAKKDFRNFGFTNARHHRAWLIGEYDLKTSAMFKPQVNWILPDGSSRRLYADRARWTNHVWTFFNVTEYAQAAAQEPFVPTLQTNVLAMPEFNETPSQIRSEIKIGGFLDLRGGLRIFGHIEKSPDVICPPRAVGV